MNRQLRTIGAYLELSRISNLPTCWTNVLVGSAIGVAAIPLPPPGFPWPIVVFVAFAISLIYVGGMALNDACDQIVDADERPGRPIPSGRVSCRGAYVYAGWCLGLGLGALTFVGTPAAALGGALVACIILYNVVHRRFAVSVVLMGACRGLVYLVAAAAVAWPLDWMVASTLAGGLAWYVTMLSIVARQEIRSGALAWRRMLTFALFLSLLAPGVVMKVQTPMYEPIEAFEWWGLGVGVAAGAWIAWSARHVLRKVKPITFRAVLGWLAGICLLDAFFVTLLAPGLGSHWPLLMGTALGCFVLTLLGHRLILGT